MSWSNDDSILATCGAEGSVYAWDVLKASRVSEIIIKSNPFKGVAITRDGKSMYAVGVDGRTRELANSNVQRDVVILQNSPLDGLALSALDTMLFVTGISNDFLYSPFYNFISLIMNCTVLFRKRGCYLCG